MKLNQYQYDGTSVFINKFDIKDPSELEIQEEYFTRIRAAELVKNPVVGAYDLPHIAEIHARLFSDLYGWAGLPRTVHSAKLSSNNRFKSQFSDPENIRELCQHASDFLSSKNFLKGLDQSEFVDFIANLQSKYNYCHPFPEGNGRATQILIRQVARDAGFEIDFGRINKREWADANAFAIPHFQLYERGLIAIPRSADPSSLKSIFSQIVSPALTITDTDALALRSHNLFVGSNDQKHGNQHRPK
jgi:cell filamentation protein